MATSVTVVASDRATGDALAALVPDTFEVTICSPDTLPASLPAIFVLELPGIDTPEEQLIERLRADEATASIPIVIISKLPMIALQSVPYASDWTIAIVEEPVDAGVLAATMSFLLNPDG